MKLVYKENIVGPRMIWMKERPKMIRIILFLGTTGTIYFSLYLDLLSILLLFFLGGISFLYAYKFKLTNKKTNLRDIPGIKIFLIGLVWSLSCGLLAAIESQSLSINAVMICAGFLLYIIGITIPFDIRDIDYDELNKKTIPQIFGAQLSKLIAISLILGSSVFFFNGPSSWIHLSIGIGLSCLLVALTTKNRNELYFSFGLDGLLIVLPLSYYLLQIL